MKSLKNISLVVALLVAGSQAEAVRWSNFWSKVKGSTPSKQQIVDTTSGYFNSFKNGAKYVGGGIKDGTKYVGSGIKNGSKQVVNCVKNNKKTAIGLGVIAGIVGSVYGFKLLLKKVWFAGQSEKDQEDTEKKRLQKVVNPTGNTAIGLINMRAENQK